MPYGREKPDNPEEEAAWVKEMKAAFLWLGAHSGEVFDFDKEQALVNAVATPRDQKVLDALSMGRHTRATDIQRVLEGERMGQEQRLLIRDADSRLVLIHPNPDELLKNPYAATGFNLQLETLYGMFKQWQERKVEVDLEWRVKWLIEDKNTEADKNESNRTDYAWRTLDDASLLAGARVIVVNPALAGYLKDEGFVADQGNTDFESRLPPDAEVRTWEGISYRLESYEDHIRLVLSFPSIGIARITFFCTGVRTFSRVAARQRIANSLAGLSASRRWEIEYGLARLGTRLSTPDRTRLFPVILRLHTRIQSGVTLCMKRHKRRFTASTPNQIMPEKARWL